MKKIGKNAHIVFFLVICILASLVSCAKNETEDEAALQTLTDMTTSAEQAEESLYSGLPTGNYNGYEFHMLQYEETASTSGGVHAEELNGEIINDDIYNRSKTVENNLNIKISLDLVSLDNVNKFMTNAINASDDIYDVFWQHTSFMMSNFTIKGYLLKLNNIGAFDFSKPWWNDTANEYIAIGQNKYVAFGDINIYLFDFQAAILYNKQIASTYGIENLYQTVDDGKWTLDKFIQLSKDFSKDLNGNGKVDKNDDMFGFGGYVTATVLGFWHGCDTALIQKDSGNMPQYNGVGEKFASVFGKISELYGDKNYSLQDDADFTKAFTGDRLLFLSQSVGGLNILRDMQSDYGIIPFPKYDEAQQTYFSFVTNQIQPMGIPVTSSDPERTGTILENLCAESYRTVRPDYFQVLLNYKYVRDEESIRMLNLIYGSPACFELEHIYMWGNVTDGTLAPAMRKGSADIVSAMAKAESKMLTDMAATVTVLGN